MKDTSKIPKGVYCYTWYESVDNGYFAHRQPCPYWSRRGDKPEQENGYCSFLEHGDWEQEHLSLLWDQCKECGINMDDENDNTLQAS